MKDLFVALDFHKEVQIEQLKNILPLPKFINPYGNGDSSSIPISIPAICDEVWVLDYVSLGDGTFAYRFNDNHTVTRWKVGDIDRMIRVYAVYVERYKEFLKLKPEPDVDYSEPEIQ